MNPGQQPSASNSSTTMEQVRNNFWLELNGAFSGCASVRSGLLVTPYRKSLGFVGSSDPAPSLEAERGVGR